MPEVVGADVQPADVVSHDDEDVRLRPAERCASRRDSYQIAPPGERAGPSMCSSQYHAPGSHRAIAGSSAPTRSYYLGWSIAYSNAKMRFQSFFMLMTIQPSFLASS